MAAPAECNLATATAPGATTIAYGGSRRHRGPVPVIEKGGDAVLIRGEDVRLAVAVQARHGDEGRVVERIDRVTSRIEREGRCEGAVSFPEQDGQCAGEGPRPDDVELAIADIRIYL